MNILLVHQNFVDPKHAGGTRHFELMSSWARQGHEATMITGTVDYLTGKKIEGTRGVVTEQQLDNIRVLRAYTLPALHTSFNHRLVAFFSFMLSSVFAGLRSGPFDVVIGTSPPIFQLVSAWLIAVFKRKPFVLEVRDLWPDFAIDIGVLKSRMLIRLSRGLESFMYARASHIVVNSPAFRDYLLAKGIAEPRISVVPNGVDPDMFHPESQGETLRNDLGLADKFIVTYAAALGMANDISTILRAAARLRDDASVHFLLVGDGKEADNLRAEAKLLRLTNVTFAGPYPKDRMNEVLAASDACLAEAGQPATAAKTRRPPGPQPERQFRRSGA
jgi:glycosyltransferase involved in cell wall biosynthesis